MPLKALSDGFGLLQHRFEFRQLVIGDIFGCLARSTAFQRVTKHVEVVEVVRIGFTDERPGAGNVFDKSLGRQPVNGFTDWTDTHSNLRGQSTVDQAVARCQLSLGKLTAYVFVGLFGKGLVHRRQLSASTFGLALQWRSIYIITWYNVVEVGFAAMA